MIIRTALVAVVVCAAACSSGGTPAPTPATTASPSAPPAVNPAAPAPRASAPRSERYSATAIIRDIAGGRVGTVTLTDSYSGVLVSGSLSGLGLGSHAIHIHETGKCEPPFTTAGAHFNPDHRKHGFMSPDGSHLGDMPNLDMPAAGQFKFEFILPDVTLRGKNALMDADGSAVVIHAGRDDYRTDPSGDSGSRIACGVITPG